MTEGSDELARAVAVVKKHIGSTLKPDKYGFSQKAHAWVDSFEKTLDFMADKQK